ncbi:phenylacetate-CoA oxygenase subunit PaaI [Euryarchaeota archaeon]|jgi:benzoyl-CoA 2,3-epoxidase subunit B|nr:phenylacetate-CoA oxygenase subunit PaaI [Euryarchaeota archaeon]MDB9834633.1 phenylacetate-CoA oxygenase subunit PaaI [Candidatus Poseidoniaceae archaeon]|tara:strand:- start:1832 stop:2992 length:1161 start_codon:yes stop_codon:yes gene_type:complete
MDNLPNTWDEWIANFSEWQDRVGFNREWMGDFDLSVQYDWDRAGDVIEFGDYAGRPKWERSLQVPHQSMRDALVAMITVQGDTEFASVEQQRHLLASAPTDYDRYAAARIMAEEQRHGWQMAHLLMTYFGQQGRREAQKLLERNAQDGDRLLGAFNRPMPHWLDFFCYTMFVDRDGKFQLGMLSTSAFKPLAASMGPMLKEESFHLGTGSNGLRRVIKAGIIPLDMLQRYINKWVSTAHDLFGVDASSSAHWSYVWGVKGRWDERKKLEAGLEVDKETLNEEARGHYHTEIVAEVQKLNGYLPEGAQQLYVPHENFHRDIGAFKKLNCTTDGDVFEGSEEDYQAYLATNMPSAQDEEDLKELFKQDWVANKPMSARQIASGIGAKA